MYKKTDWCKYVKVKRSRGKVLNPDWHKTELMQGSVVIATEDADKISADILMLTKSTAFQEWILSVWSADFVDRFKEDY